MPSSPDATTRLILVLGLGAGASSLAGRALDPLMGVLSLEFGVAAATAALLGTAYALPYALVQPVLGPIGDAIGKQRVIRACLLLLAIALAACAAAPDIVTLGVLRVLSGAASGGIFPLAIAVIGDRVPIEKRQVALSRLLVAGLTGWVGGGALAAALGPLIGWRGVMLVCAAASVAALLVLRERDAVPAGGRPNLAEALARYRAILGNPAARVLYAAVFVEGSLVFGVFPFLAPLFTQRGHDGAAEAGLALTAFGLGGFAFGALAPAMLRGFGQSRMMMLGGCFSATALTVVALSPFAWLAIAAVTLLGLGFYMVHSSIQTRVTEVAPGSRGSAVALHAFHFFLGQSLGPVLMGVGWSVLGPVPALLVVGGGLLLLALWLGSRRPSPGGR
jgi:predicted MFS family arabinose efflux permease